MKLIDLEEMQEQELSELIEKTNSDTLSGVIVKEEQMKEVKDWMETLGIDVFYMKFDEKHMWITTPKSEHRIQIEMRYL